LAKFQYHIDCVICKGLGSLPAQPKKGLIMQCVHCGAYMIIVEVSGPKGSPIIDGETEQGMLTVKKISSEEFDVLVKAGIIH
jgi:hypothetical protein